MSYDPQTKKFVSPAEKLSLIPTGEIKFAPKDGRKWYVLVVGTHNILTRNTKCVTGILAMHLRHLEKIGYIPILVSQNIFFITNTKIYVIFLFQLLNFVFFRYLILNGKI